MPEADVPPQDDPRGETDGVQDEPTARDIAERLATSWEAVVSKARDAAERHPAASDTERPALVKTVRKATKTGRALVRLLRGAMPREVRDGVERLFGDAASLLSPIRDRDAMIDTVDRLLDGKNDERVHQARLLLVSIVSPPPVGDDQIAFENGLVRRAAALIAAADEAIRALPADSITPSVVADGMADLWRRARRRANRRWQGEGCEAHEIRKSCSRLVHQLTLVEDDLPRSVRKFRQKLRKVNSALGDEHDLAILAECIGLHRSRLGATFSEAVLQVCRKGRERLQEQAGIELAEAMTMKPKQLGRTLRRAYRPA